MLDARAELVETLAERMRVHSEGAAEQTLALARDYRFEELLSIIGEGQAS